MKDDLKKKWEKNEDDIKKNLFLIPLKFRANLWLSSLRFLYSIFVVILLKILILLQMWVGLLASEG